MSAAEAWNAIANAVREHQPTAVLVSPEIYFEQTEFVQNVCSEYVSTAPEHARLPWLGVEGVPVAVDPMLEPRRFALLHSRDFVDDMRIALDIYTHGMESEEFEVG